MRTLVTLMLAALIAQAGARPAILAGNTRLSTAVAQGDLAAVVAVYADDAEIVPNGQPPVTGKRAIEAMWKSALESGIREFSETISDVDTNGNTANEQGTYTMKLANGQLYQRGTYHNVWKKEKGIWKLKRNEWTIAR